MSLQKNKGELVRVAQDAILMEYSEKEMTLFYKERLPKTVIAIYLRKFIEFNDHLCELIIGDKILYASEDDLREIINDKDNKICVYRGTNNFI